ncbi:MAG: hypothetical protein A3G49_05495 [Candidatus Sungbacteria bacterium RIFCSPLOWO2_12_FULL_41_11]|uniref:Uncharacterized protein n=1 Tax=Candidatus Sungbacteria bacterium RIFCSPLOWO2_12_FULL_41_11 TaxID=1802286 RepID=A0A1G2LSL0_9BACT|nr:MAG: hypothetical protein A3G49_05495 [Candidatus Sungbacteria bacterium RIFCSPLOWO2_12_FULL_41_11]
MANKPKNLFRIKLRRIRKGVNNMAQEVGYFENNPVYQKGPFVIVSANGWRIEAELKGHHCPVLPASSIYAMMEKLGLRGKTNDKEKAALVCDILNGMVRTGQIVLHDNGCWVDVWSVFRAQEKAEQVLREVQ